MPFTRDNLEHIHGQPVIRTNHVSHSNAARGGARRAPHIIPDDRLVFSCGAVAEIGFGGNYNLIVPCNEHQE